MTVSTTSFRVTVQGNGATSTFPFSFTIPAQSTASLIYTDAGGVAELLPPNAWTLTRSEGGGTFTYPLSGDPIASGTSLTLLRSTPQLQGIAFPIQGLSTPAVTEAALDALTMMVQELPGWGTAPTDVPVSPAMQPIVGAASAAAALAALGGATNPLTATPGQYLATSIGNAIPGYSATLVNVTAGHAGLWENAGSWQITSATPGNKVAGYFAAAALAGSGPVWAINPLVSIGAGITTGCYQSGEIDVANLSGHHFGDGATDIGPDAVFGMQVTGISTGRCTAAIAVFGNLPDAAPMWNRGIVFSNNSIRLATIQDFTSSTTVLDARGSHTYGVDFRNGGFSAGTIRLGNQQNIVGRKADDSSDVSMLQINAGDSVVIGYPTAATNVLINCGLAPLVDNAVPCGASALRWGSVWAANGSIQTSDPRLKTDVAALPPALPIVAAISPIRYRWIDGGKELVDGEWQSRPGRRVHWGWDALQVRDVMSAYGDFAGYVQGDDGTHHLRPDQLVPILWQAVQELSAKVAALESKLP